MDTTPVPEAEGCGFESRLAAVIEPMGWKFYKMILDKSSHAEIYVATPNMETRPSTRTRARI